MKSRILYICLYLIAISLSLDGFSQALTIVSVNQTNETCFTSNNGTITIVISGGASPYNYYLISGSLVLQSPATINLTYTFTNLEALPYTIIVSDNLSSSVGNFATITQPSEITGSILSQTDVLCFGLSTGSVTILASGGTGPYTYNIDGGAFVAGATFNGLAAGSHPVQVKDANGCTVNVPVTIAQPASALSGSISNQDDISCNGLADGSVTIDGAGGTLPYTFNLDGGAFGPSSTFNGLLAGPHTAQVKDDNNCISDVAVTIDQPDVLGGNITGQTNVLCFGLATGSVTVAGTGGTGSFTYNIDGGAFGASGTFNGLTAGGHTIQVKDVNNCTANVAINISQPVAAVSGNITSQTNVLCFGTTTGSVTVTGAGGTVAYIYNIDGSAFSASGTFNNLASGDHTVQVKDINNCTADVNVTITQPATAVSGSITGQTDVSCNGLSDGAVTVTGAGGTFPYTYNIDGGAFVASGTFNTLAAGAHTVQVMDANNCTVNVPVTIAQPVVLSGSISGQTNVLCFGTGTGSVTVEGAGGSGPYTYNIDGGAFGGSGTFNALGAGVHTVQVKDANTCTANVAITITQPASAVSGSITGQTNVLCFGSTTGSVTVAAAGGTSPYTYNIDGGTFGASAIFNNLGAGPHPVQVKDDHGCTANIAVVITQPATAVSGSITSQANILCFGSATGSATVAGAGGIGPFTYNIDGGAFSGSGTFIVLAAGPHTVQVKDNNNCTADVIVTITQAPEITATITSTGYVDASTQGTITISGAAGGTGTLTFSILGLGGPFTATTFYNNLPPATYPVVIKDDNGCLYQQSVKVPVKLNVTVTINNAKCNGSDDASISMAATNGIGLVEYSIDDSASWSPNGNFNQLSPGTYYIFVKDSDLRYFQDTLTVGEPTAISIFSNVTPTSCALLSNDGAIDIIVVGGTGSKTYLWSTGAVSQDISGLIVGDYTVDITDQNNCISSKTIRVPSMTTVNADAGNDTILCYGEGIILSGTGGATYSWAPVTGLSNPNIANPVVAPLTQDISYILTAVGFNGCFDNDTIFITLRPPLTLNAGNDTSILRNTSISLQAAGDPFVNYFWAPSTGLSNPDASITNATLNQTTTYILTAVDSFGCIKSDTININVVGLKIYNVFSPNNDGQNDFWDIDNTEFFPDVLVEVYSRWGQKLFSSKGYSNDKRWDGTYKGSDVPIGTYYYVIIPSPNNSENAQTGPLTIVR